MRRKCHLSNYMEPITERVFEHVGNEIVIVDKVIGHEKLPDPLDTSVDAMLKSGAPIQSINPRSLLTPTNPTDLEDYASDFINKISND